MDRNEFLNKKLFFLDFETNKKEDFFLVGLEIEDIYTCYIVEKNLYPLIENKAYQSEFNLETASTLNLVSKILSDVYSHKGILVGFSFAEMKLIRKLYDYKNIPDVQYLNLNIAAKLWRRKFYKKEYENLPNFRQNKDNKFIAKKSSLASIMRLLPKEIQAPTDYAPGKTTSRINDIIKGLNHKKKYDNLTAVQKGKATKLLKHNKFDVVAMKPLLDDIIKKNTVLSFFDKALNSLQDDRYDKL